MFGLTQQIGGADFPIHGFIGDHQGFGGACKQINAHAPIELAFGLCDKGIAGAHQHIDGLDALRAQRHGGHGLNTTQHQNLVRTAQMHGGNNSGMRAALMRRG